jgi:hypothetical protein
VKFKPRRTDRLSPQEREIVDRFERGVIDATEAGRLLIESVNSAGSDAAAPTDERVPETVEPDPDALHGTDEDAKARELVERIARDVYDDPA